MAITHRKPTGSIKLKKEIAAQPAVSQLEHLDASALSEAFNGMSLKIRQAVMGEIVRSPDKYVDLLEPVQERRDHPAITAMALLSKNFSHGSPLSTAEMNEMERLISNQEQKAKAFSALIQTLDFTRLANFTRARERLESVILAVAERGELTVDEVLAFLAYMTGEMLYMEKKITTTQTMGALEQFLASIKDTPVADKLAEQDSVSDTTSAGREIVRRIGHALLKQMNDKTGTK